MVANGHGPLLQHNVGELIERYRRWSQAQTKAEKLVVVFYASDYGYSDRLSQAIARGITKAGVGVEMIDLKSAEPQEVQETVNRAAGIVMGMPPTTNTTATAAVSTILAAAKSKQTIGVFESYGGDDEPIDPLLSQFRNLGLKEAFPSIRIKETPSEATNCAKKQVLI